MNFETQLLQFVLSGLATGATYAIVALGFVTIYNVTKVLNFAQGEFVMMGGMLLWAFHSSNMPMWLSFLLAVIIVTLTGVLMERLVLRPATKASPLTLIIMTIGASTAIRGAALIVWGKDAVSVPGYTPGPSVFIFGAALNRQSIWVIGLTLLMLLGLYLFFEKTLLGKALIACSINKPAARLMGISANSMSLISFALSAALGGAAGAVVTPVIMASYDMGLMTGLKGFVAAIFGGLNSPLGGVLAGFIIGILEALSAGLISSGYRDATVFVILLLVLFFRPTGVFTTEFTAEREAI